MKLLLDAHALLWWLADDRRLATRARTALKNRANQAWVSAGTIWEIEIKRRLGRLEVRGDLLEACSAEGFLELPISAIEATTAASLPLHHADPFDRILIAQASLHDLTCVTRDEIFREYDVSTLW